MEQSRAISHEHRGDISAAEEQFLLKPVAIDAQEPNE